MKLIDRDKLTARYSDRPIYFESEKELAESLMMWLDGQPDALAPKIHEIATLMEHYRKAGLLGEFFGLRMALEILKKGGNDYEVRDITG